MWVRSACCPLWLVLTLTLACGSAKHQTGGAAGASGGPRAGEPCTNGSCPQGLTCEHVGVFHGLCTASCSSDPGCGLLNPRAHCFGQTNQECALPCSIDTECPSGTHCVSVGALGSERACQLF
jgi:hypothetical protein